MVACEAELHVLLAGQASDASSQMLFLSCLLFFHHFIAHVLLTERTDTIFAGEEQGAINLDRDFVLREYEVSTRT
jgi:hypothetical protein